MSNLISVPPRRISSANSDFLVLIQNSDWVCANKVFYHKSLHVIETILRSTRIDVVFMGFVLNFLEPNDMLNIVVNNTHSRPNLNLLPIFAPAKPSKPFYFTAGHEGFPLFLEISNASNDNTL